MRRTSAFTLVEVLTGIVVIATISTCSWFAVSTLFRGEQLNRNRTVATNLLQKSQEELRNAALSFYDSLENCQFPGPAFDAGNNVCGLQVLREQFNGFTRAVDVTSQNGSTEIKKALITVTWTDQGVVKTMDSAVLIARPPDHLPGNIIGTVRSSTTENTLVDGVSITATLIGGSVSRTTTSKPALGDKDENYDFFDSSTRAFVLPVGTWRITATHPSYYNYPASGNDEVIVTSNAETPHDFKMDPKPDDATLNIHLINANTNTPIPTFEYGYIYLRDDYAETTQTIASNSSSPTLTVTVHFNNANPKSFTIANNYAYRAGYAAKTNSLGAPSCVYHYAPNGWSSAVQQADDTMTCANPYNGSIATDRILVNPGETGATAVNVNVPLFPVPTATVKGKVVDKRGVGLAGAVLYARWPDNQYWWRKNGSYQTATTDADGNYTYVIPAAQEMFANDATGAITLRAEHNMPYNGCCATAQQKLMYGYLPITNLFAEATIPVANIEIPDATDSTCGNVKGNLKDDSNGSTLSGVSISVQGTGNSTDDTGNYIYQCLDSGYRLPIGLARFYATKASYYSYDSNGNNWYARVAGVNIETNSMTTYDGKLWPVGAGTVVVNVTDAGSNSPISDAIVSLKTYNGVDTPIITGADGKSTFNNIIETWPPNDLPADLFYNQTARSHSLTVIHPSGFYDNVALDIPTLQKDDTLIINVQLTPHGGT